MMGERREGGRVEVGVASVLWYIYILIFSFIFFAFVQKYGKRKML